MYKMQQITHHACCCSSRSRESSIFLKHYVKNVPAFDHCILVSASCYGMPNLYAALLDATLVI